MHPVGDVVEGEVIREDPFTFVKPPGIIAYFPGLSTGPPRKPFERSRPLSEGDIVRVTISAIDRYQRKVTVTLV
jgi:hypothetical protein